MKKRNYIYHLFVSHGDERYGFTNTIDGIINQLDYIQEMNFNCLMTNPLFPSTEFHGYHVKTFWETSEDLGGEEAFDRLIKELEKRDMYLIFDITFNHTSKEHKYYQDYLEGKNDYYVMVDEKGEDIASDMHDTKYFWDEEQQKYLICAFGDFLPALNVESEEYKKEIGEIIKFWLGKSKRIGLRCDAILHSRVTAKNHDCMPFVKYIRDVANEVNPNALMIGEVWINSNMREEPVKFAKTLGCAFDFSTCFDILLQVRDGKTFDEVEINEHHFKHNYCCMIDNHDMTRVRSFMGGDLEKVKTALRVLIEKTQGDISIYYATELGYMGEVANGYDIPVRQKINYTDMAYAIKDENSLFHYIKKLIAEDKKKRNK